MCQVRVHVYISGKVQGVFFRSYTKDKAQKEGLNGWVKNLTDGRVEIVLEGNKEKCEEMLQWCHKGSPSSKVENVEIYWDKPTNNYKHFNVRYG
tara:strand:- start:915 stop:1196 length:282 start_codon:yes stop_codon:yes gene_type:complete